MTMVLAGLVSSDVSLLGLRMATFSLSSHSLSLVSPVCPELLF